ncbi:Nucleic acid-binding, OB-fold [Cynara cardunculus var. scolymus]|uniref:Nucleic acid-binding, OB-fold n=1 Tax=Cynara cardunculus var. scolymus TaxID=59895 RepID=A0A103YC52_CYNCS|nr:Nucleic acid-binding, OB-fold [Cynara cardunculus var. scolymus]
MRGEGCVFNVELTDENASGTQMQATMFNEAARKFFDRLEIGKVYCISKGTIKVANKQFGTVDNDYEMTLSKYSRVMEAINESILVPERRFNFVPIDQLGLYFNQKDLVDKSSRKKSVVVCLWNDHATYLGQELLDMVDKSPVVAIKSLKVRDFRGVSLPTLPNSYIRINHDISQCLKLRSW